MAYRKLFVTHGNGRIAFTTRDSGLHPWYRDLDLDSQPVYRIGSICDTCEALFRRVAAPELSLTPFDLAARLRNGIELASDDLVNTVAAILPDGHYAVSLLKILPQPVPPEDQPIEEACRRTYLHRSQVSAILGLREYFLPLTAEMPYDPATIDGYQRAILDGKRPTALALSVLDVRYPSAKAFIWQLAHFLLDGYHKIAAASQAKLPITLLSFFALDQSFAPQSEIERVLKTRY